MGHGDSLIHIYPLTFNLTDKMNNFFIIFICCTSQFFVCTGEEKKEIDCFEHLIFDVPPGQKKKECDVIGYNKVSTLNCTIAKCEGACSWSHQKHKGASF